MRGLDRDQTVARGRSTQIPAVHGVGLDAIDTCPMKRARPVVRFDQDPPTARWPAREAWMTSLRATDEHGGPQRPSATAAPVSATIRGVWMPG